MARKFEQIPTDTFDTISMNAGVLLDTFNPASPTYENTAILCATNGGMNFTDAVTYKDNGEDIDNCPKNTMELKTIDSREIKLSGTSVTATSKFAQRLIGAADVSTNKITPRDELKTADFSDLWLVGDYGAEDGGFIAIHLLNTLSTGGLNFQTTSKEKSKFSFEFTAHYSLKNQGVVPYEVYIQKGGVVA